MSNVVNSLDLAQYQKNEKMKRVSIGRNLEPDPEKRDSKQASLPTIGSVRVHQCNTVKTILYSLYSSQNFMANSQKGDKGDGCSAIKRAEESGR